MFLSQLICFPSGRAIYMTSVCMCVRLHGEWQGNLSCFPDVGGKEGNEENRPDKRENDVTTPLCLCCGRWCLSGDKSFVTFKGLILSKSTAGPLKHAKTTASSLCKGIHFVNTSSRVFFLSLYTWPWVFLLPRFLFLNKLLSQKPQQRLSTVISLNLLASSWAGSPADTCFGCNLNFLLACYSTWPLSDLSVAWAVGPLKLRT